MAHTSLMHLFNIELVDFVKQNEDGTYTPVEWPKEATHELIPTSWNSHKKYKPNKHGKLVMPDGFALSVCAVPMHRKVRFKGPPVKITRTLPAGKDVHVYSMTGEVTGKRAVLLWMIEQMRAKVKKNFVKRATSAQCDNLYRNLMVSNAALRRA